MSHKRKPQMTKIESALAQLVKNNPEVVEVINCMTVFEKRQLRDRAAQLKIRSELLRTAYQEWKN